MTTLFYILLNACLWLYWAIVYVVAAFVFLIFVGLLLYWLFCILTSCKNCKLYRRYFKMYRIVPKTLDLNNRIRSNYHAIPPEGPEKLYVND